MVPPRGSITFWSLILHPYEEGLPSKTGEFDETVMVKVEEFKLIIAAVARLLKIRTRQKAELLLHATAAEVNNYMKALVEKHNLEPLVHQVHLYRLRHGGASHAYASGLMSLQEIQRQGRWKSTKSLRRYEKGGRLSQLMNSLPDSLDMMSAPQRLMTWLRRM